MEKFVEDMKRYNDLYGNTGVPTELYKDTKEIPDEFIRRKNTYDSEIV
jgi:hypothetical protein